MSEEDLLEKVVPITKRYSSSSNSIRRTSPFFAKQNYNLSDFLHDTLKAHSESELTGCFLKYLAQFGLDRFVMSEMSFDNFHHKERHHGILANFPQDWMGHYIKNQYIKDDAIYSLAQTARKPFLWNEVKDDPRTPARGKLILEEAKEFKLSDGIGLSIHKPFGQIIGMGIASSSGGVEMNSGILAEINAAAHQFYLVFSELVGEKSEVDESIKLTTRELEVVFWLSRGKTVPEIATILGISEAGVKYHRQNIYQKLGVDNCRSAVLKALRSGLVKPF